MCDDKDLELLKQDIANSWREFHNLWEISSEINRMIFNQDIQRLKIAAHYRFRLNELQNIINVENLSREKRYKFSIYILTLNLILITLSLIFLQNYHLVFASLIILLTSLAYFSTIYIMQFVSDSLSNNLKRLFHEQTDRIIPNYSDDYLYNKEENLLYEIWLRKVSDSELVRLSLDYKWSLFCRNLLQNISKDLKESKSEDFYFEEEFYSNPFNYFVPNTL